MSKQQAKLEARVAALEERVDELGHLLLELAIAADKRPQQCGPVVDAQQMFINARGGERRPLQLAPVRPAVDEQAGVVDRSIIQAQRRTEP